MASNKPVIGITIGDVNGIGAEIIIKTFLETRMFEFCTPVIYGSAKLLSANRKLMNLPNFNYNVLKDDARLSLNAMNVVNCWEEEITPTFGQANPAFGKYAFSSIETAATDYKEGKIQAIVTAPINKRTIHSDNFPFNGHTEYFTGLFPGTESAMMMVGENMRVCMATHHVPLKEVAAKLNADLISSKIEVIKNSLQKDFGIDKCRIAVLGLNPHASDEGLMGNEEDLVIKPAIKKAKDKGYMVFGPYPADGFFGAGNHLKFDCILAMYHDQGLIPFKALNFGNGVNYTAGLPLVRTSPDHGTAYDIAGKGEANEDSFREAIFLAADILKQRANFNEMTANPLQRNNLQRERH